MIPSIPIALLLLPSAGAVNFYDGVRPPGGLYWVNYLSTYGADRATDADGAVAAEGLGFRRYDETARFSWYFPGGTLCAVVPFGGQVLESAGLSSWGLGEVALGGGAFLPVEGVDVLPMLFVKAPSAPVASDPGFRYGTNQWDLRPMVFAWAGRGAFTVDLAAKGYLRLADPDTGVAPGHELHLQALGGWRFGGRYQAGPSVSWAWAADPRAEGEPIEGAGRAALSAGLDAWMKTGWGSLSATWTADAWSRGTTRGSFLQVKTVVKAF